MVGIIRRKAAETQRIGRSVLKIVQTEGKITLTDIISKHGARIGVKHSPNDKALIKRQLSHLAQSGQIQFGREGRNIVAVATTQPTSRAASAGAPSSPPASASPVSVPSATAPQLEAIEAYAEQLQEFGRTLQDQIATLLRMISKVKRERS